MRLIVIEGCDGTGTSTHTGALTDSLRALGIDAVAFHHPPPPKGCSPWTRGIHYASERSKLVDQYGDTDVVVVADRWYHSTFVFSHTVEDAPLRAQLNQLVAMEMHALPAPVLVVVLDAMDAELDRRLTKRGEVVRPSDTVERAAYRELVDAYTYDAVDTGPSKDSVRAKLLGMSLSALSRA